MKFAILIIGVSLLSMSYVVATATPRRVRVPGWPNPPPSER
jgi:hypothetical protein